MFKAISARRSTEGLDALKQRYKVAQKTLKIAIRRAKEEAWRNLVKMVDDDIWEKPYKKISRVLRESP